MTFFDHPVRAAVFMAAIIGLVERLIRMAGRKADIFIQVVFTGDAACAIWSYNTVNGELIIRGTIKLPALKANSMVDRNKANRWVAYTIHEVWHVVFTHNGVWQTFCRQQVPLVYKLANALEDARIERSGMALGYADGFKVVGRELLTHMMADGGMAVNPNDPRQLPWALAVYARGYGVKGEREFLSKLDPRIDRIFAEATLRCAAIPASIDAQTGTKAVCEIALWVFAQLKKLGEDKAPPDEPVGPGGDEEGEDGDDGEPGDGEPGEPGDGPGRGKGKGKGKPAPLKVGDKVVCPDGVKGIIAVIEGDDATVVAL